MALTPKQELFVAEYLVDLNATQAAIRAGYSEATARAQGSRLLTNVDIATAIEKGADKRLQRVRIDADTVLRELLRLGTLDVANAYKPDGTLKNIHDIPEDTRRAIAGVEVGADGETVKVKFWDKRGSLELLGKHLALFTEKIEHSGAIRLEDMIAQSRAR